MNIELETKINNSEKNRENSKDVALKTKYGRKVLADEIKNKDDKNARKYKYKEISKNLFFIFCAALIFNFGIVVFLQRADTIPTGISGVVLLINFIWPATKPYFAILFILSNAPLLIIFFTKIKKSFTYYTLMFMVFQILVNYVLTRPVIESWIIDHITVTPHWKNKIEFILPGKTPQEALTYLPEQIRNGFFKPEILLSQNKEYFYVWVESPESWPIFIDCVVGATFVGFGISLAWKFGGSTGGTDIIGYYYSTKKKKNVSSILATISVLLSIIFLITFGFATPHHFSIEQNFDSGTLDTASNVIRYGTNYTIKPRLIIGAREFSTMLYILVIVSIMEIFYPKYKKVSMEISCGNNYEKVVEYFASVNYWHSYKITEHTSGYSHEKIYTISTTMLYFEAKLLLDDIKEIDHKLWIQIIPVNAVRGHFTTKFID
ncbi:YitT family protein [Mycoplasmopsis opalescens]|uniref:YitT family protein n=1 Tax=Mycoplasmopsis opalescens TaxID=114886 RepID=UPI00068DD49A|nr:YitT family protein [Mycoplasmopsis opalescens]